MKKKLFVFSIVLIAAMLVVTPVLAITFGELDGEGHPNVGALLVAYPYPNGDIDIVCTGTLIAPDVFLTAAHCVDWLPGIGVPPDDVFVTFDSVYEIGVSTIYPGTYHLNPNYGHDNGDLHDVAVIVLDEPIYSIAPASLPTAGLLDEMKDNQELKNRPFVAVGYGTVRDDKTGGPHALYWEGARRVATGTYAALTQSWLKISMNPSTGDGGTCYGDSGGPHFLDYNGTDLLVSLTVTGDIPCRATDVTYRLDTPSARTYLEQFVELP
jgi:secreted trypsin-like serine protease